MSAPQFTPGPWDALPKADYVHVAGKGHIAKITNPWNDRAEREANTHLIAAAPELYEAADDARLFVELVRMRAAREGDEDQAHEAAEALTGILAALAKAQGHD